MARDSRRSPFLEQVRGAIRVRHYSVRTEHAYVGWIKRFIHTACAIPGIWASAKSPSS